MCIRHISVSWWCSDATSGMLYFVWAWACRGSGDPTNRPAVDRQSKSTLGGNRSHDGNTCSPEGQPRSAVRLRQWRYWRLLLRWADEPPVYCVDGVLPPLGRAIVYRGFRGRADSNSESDDIRGSTTEDDRGGYGGESMVTSDPEGDASAPLAGRAPLRRAHTTGHVHNLRSVIEGMP